MVLLGSIVGDIWDALVRGFFRLLWWIARAMGALLDFCQSLVRKLVGLDTYYYDNVVVDGAGENAVTSDIIEMLIRSDIVRNLFISLLVLGVILLFIVTFISVWKSEWNFDKDANSKSKIINAALRAVFNFIAVPVITFFGIFVGNALLRAIDGATSLNSERGMSDLVFASLCSNAVRTEHTDDSFNRRLIDANDNIDEATNVKGIYQYFTTSLTGDINSADIIQAFRENHKLTDKGKYKIYVDSVEGADHIDVWQINKDLENGNLVFTFRNTDLVDVFFDHTEMNYLIAYIVLIFMIKAMLTITFGLIKRLFNLVILFIISPPIVAMTPINDKALGEWRKMFISNATSAYVTIAIYNIFLSIYPLFEKITLFSNGKGLFGGAENFIVSALMVCVGLLSIQELSGAISKLLGTGNVYEDSVGKDGKSLWGGAFSLAGSGLKPGLLVGKAVAKADQYRQIAKYEGMGSALKTLGKDSLSLGKKAINAGPVKNLWAGAGITKVDKDGNVKLKDGVIKQTKDLRTKWGVKENAAARRQANSEANRILKDAKEKLGEYKEFTGLKNDQLVEKMNTVHYADKRNKYIGVRNKIAELEAKETLTEDEQKELKTAKQQLGKYGFTPKEVQRMELEEQFLKANDNFNATRYGGAKGLLLGDTTTARMVRDGKNLSKEKQEAVDKTKEAIANQTAMNDAQKQVVKEQKQAVEQAIADANKISAQADKERILKNAKDDIDKLRKTIASSNDLDKLSKKLDKLIEKLNKKP